MPKRNAKYTHTRVLMSNGKIEPVTIMTRTSEDDVTVRRFNKDTSFQAVTTTRTCSDRTIKFLTQYSAPTNLVLNGSATTTSTTNWTAGSRNTSIFKTTPASWLSVNYDPTETQAVEYFDANMLTVGTRYSLSFWARAMFSGFPITVTFYTGSGSSTITINPSTTAFEYFKIENKLCYATTSGSIFIDSLANFYIDDVAIVAGATAV